MAISVRVLSDGSIQVSSDEDEPVVPPPEPEDVPIIPSTVTKGRRRRRKIVIPPGPGPVVTVTVPLDFPGARDSDVPTIQWHEPQQFSVALRDALPRASGGLINVHLAVGRTFKLSDIVSAAQLVAADSDVSLELQLVSDPKQTL
jgi:hypothetical protein